VVLTTYSVLASEYLPSGGTAKRSFDQDCLAPMHSIVWKRVVLDEAHVVSNRLTQQSRAVLALKARARWVVTGTPIQNRIEDLYPLMAFLKIHPLDDFHWFTR
jgi:SNF2 family DNA or RNA helicase